MYNITIPKKSELSINDSFIGEPLETKIRRWTTNKEPIPSDVPPLYTDRKDGVKKEYDIRTDKWELATEGMDVVTKTKLAKRELTLGERTYEKMSTEQQTEFNKKYPQNKHAIKAAQQQKTEGTA